MFFLNSLAVDEPRDLEDGGLVSGSNINSEKAKVGTAEFLIQLENKRSIKVSDHTEFLSRSCTYIFNKNILKRIYKLDVDKNILKKEQTGILPSNHT